MDREPHNHLPKESRMDTTVSKSAKKGASASAGANGGQENTKESASTDASPVKRRGRNSEDNPRKVHENMSSEETPF